VSFYGYMVNRDERPAVVFEAVFSDQYFCEQVADATAEGFTVEQIEDWVRITFVEQDGKPWIYREFYPVKEDEPTVGPRV